MSGHDPSPSRSVRLFRRLLALFPIEFRTDYGREMEQVFRDQEREAHGRRGAVTSLWLRTLRDIAKTAPGEHIAVLARDLRFATRLMTKNPGMTLVAVVTLSLGIGANAALFTWIKAMAIDPLPGVAAPRELVMVAETDANGAGCCRGVSFPNLLDYQRENKSFSGILGHEYINAHLRVGTRTVRAQGAIVTGNYFDVLGVQARLGRTFLSEEDRTPNTHPVVVLSHSLWQRELGGDRAAVGSQIQLNGHAFTLIGVTPPEFQGASIGQRLDLWVPTMMQGVVVPGRDYLNGRGSNWLDGLGRLAPGIDLATARNDLARVSSQLTAEYPDINEDRFLTAFWPSQSPLGIAGAVMPVLTVLAGVVAVVLLIACSNVASLLLARASARRKEIAMRLALGASRLRLVRQLLTESFLLASVAGLGGLLVSVWANRGLMSLAPPLERPLELNLGVDTNVLLFTLLASALTALLFGLLPALQATRTDLVPALHDAAAGGSGVSRARRGLVVAQVAFSVMALACAGLFLRSLERTQQVDPGFAPSGVLMASIDVFPAGYDAERGRLFYSQLIERVEALPGVESASLARRPPLTHRGPRGTWIAEIEDYEPEPEERMGTLFDTVGPRYFETLKIPLLLGRDFEAWDASGTTSVVVVNRTFAERYWPDQSPIGKRVKLANTWHEVIGVAQDVKYRRLGERSRWYMYTAQQQTYEPDMTLLVRSAQTPLTLAEPLRELLREMDAELPLFAVTSMENHVARALLQPRLATTSALAFGLMALVMAAIGLYGVVSFWVSQLSQSIGVRLAIGARPSHVFGMVTWMALRLTLTGLAIGLPLAFGASRLVESMLVGVSAGDPTTFAAVVAALVIAAIVASALPAWRATRVDPVSALRYE